MSVILEMLPILIGIGGIVLGAAALIQLWMYKPWSLQKKDDTLDKRINNLTSSLKQSIKIIDQIQFEIEERQKLADKLRKDVDSYNEIAKLKKSEVDAVAQLLRGELKKESKKSFWQGVAVNFIFFLLGAGVSMALTFFYK